MYVRTYVCMYVCNDNSSSALVTRSNHTRQQHRQEENQQLPGNISIHGNTHSSVTPLLLLVSRVLGFGNTWKNSDYDSTGALIIRIRFWGPL